MTEALANQQGENLRSHVETLALPLLDVLGNVKVRAEAVHSAEIHLAHFTVQAMLNLRLAFISPRSPLQGTAPQTRCTR